MEKDRGFSTLGFFKDSFSGLHNQEVIKCIAQLPIQDLVVKQIQIASKVVPFAFVLEVCNVGNNLLHWSIGVKFSVEFILKRAMLGTGSFRLLLLSHISVDSQALHRFHNGVIRKKPAILPEQGIVDRTVSLGRIVRMYIRNVVVQLLPAFLIAVQGAFAF